MKETQAGALVKANKNLHFSNVHVLLAEDNPVNQMVATAMLEKYGLRVTPAGDGEETVKQIKSRHFDLVLMDCQMSVMDGYEATKIIRKLEEHQKRPRVPVIALTANAMKGDDEKCLATGMDDYIPKPLRQGDLERVLLKWLPKEKTGGQIMTDSADALDMEVFNAFAELMGENLSMILVRHLETVAEYLKTIHGSLDNGDFKAMSYAAHPLKSSSQQIGAMKVAGIAAEIEHRANAAAPDIAQLRALAEKAETMQADLSVRLQPHIIGVA